MKVSTRITNPGFSRDVDFYFAIKVGNSYYFYPDWGTSPTPNRKSLTDNSNPTFEELLSLPISDQTPTGSYTFAAAITEPGTTNIFGFLDYQSFAIRSATTSQIYFLDALKKG